MLRLKIFYTFKNVKDKETLQLNHKPSENLKQAKPVPKLFQILLHNRLRKHLMYI